MGRRINKVSRLLYAAARTSRDVEAVDRAIETGSPAPVAARAERRIVGRMLWKTLWRLFR